MLKNIVKIIFYVAILMALVIAGIYFYYQHEDSLRKKAKLNFNTKHKWSWENEYAGVQITYEEEIKRSILRKVHLNDGYAVYAYKNDDYTLSTAVVFLVKCKPKTSITTTGKFSNGESKILICNEEGDSLTYEVTWPSNEPITSWNENLDGYKVDESFYSWNFDKLDKEITLNKAK